MTWLTEKRYQEREFDAEGHLIHPTMPERMHGTSTGYMSFGCKCGLCRSWWKDYRMESVERKRHNERILKLLQGGGEGDSGNIAKLETAAVKPGGEGGDTVPEQPKPRKPKQRDPVVTDWVDDDSLGLAATDRQFEALRPQLAGPTEPAAAEKIIGRAEIVMGSISDYPPPPLTPQIRDRITTVAMLEKIKKAYYEPDWVAPADRKMSEGKHRERRAHGNMEIIIGEDANAPVIWFREREVAQGKSEVLTATPKALPKAHGGRGGNTVPNDTKAIVAALKAAGCEVTYAGSGHIKATKNGQTITLPSTPSEWRSIMNTWSNLKRSGILAS